MTLVNLNKARKEKLRAEKRKKADENAVKFGRAKAERAADDTAKTRADTHLDNHKRTP